jgi:hypothetical protein
LKYFIALGFLLMSVNAKPAPLSAQEMEIYNGFLKKARQEVKPTKELATSTFFSLEDTTVLTFNIEDCAEKSDYMKCVAVIGPNLALGDKLKVFFLSSTLVLLIAPGNDQCVLALTIEQDGQSLKLKNEVCNLSNFLIVYRPISIKVYHLFQRRFGQLVS